MNKVKKIICIALIFLMSMQNAYGFSDIKFPDESEIRESIESEYGIKIIINGYEQNRNVTEWLKIIDYSLEKFPEGVIREITDSNLNEGISTSIIFNRESNLMKIPVQYIKTDSSADIYINILYSGVYGEISSAYVELFMHEVSSMIGGYLLESYGHDNIKEEFEELNGEYRYGTWGDGYSKVFAGSHSAASVEDDLTDLIMTAELYPDKLNDVNDGSREIIHGKIELVSEIFDETFNSVTEKTKLYLETVPNEPDEWAKDEIYSMIESGLIPENMKLNYNSCITREDFAVLLKNAIKNKLGEENFYEYFKIEKPEANFILDPLNGEALIEDGLPYLYYDMHFIENKEDICDIYRIGLVTVSDYKFRPDAPVSRMSVARYLIQMSGKLGVDIVGLGDTSFSTMENIKDCDKPYLGFAVKNGIIKGDGSGLLIYDSCTYQEAFIMLDRICALVDEGNL